MHRQFLIKHGGEGFLKDEKDNGLKIVYTFLKETDDPLRANCLWLRHNFKNQGQEKIFSPDFEAEIFNCV